MASNVAPYERVQRAETVKGGKPARPVRRECSMACYRPGNGHLSADGLPAKTVGLAQSLLPVRDDASDRGALCTEH